MRKILAQIKPRPLVGIFLNASVQYIDFESMTQLGICAEYISTDQAQAVSMYQIIRLTLPQVKWARHMTLGTGSHETRYCLFGHWHYKAFTRQDSDSRDIGCSKNYPYLSSHIRVHQTVIIDSHSFTLKTRCFA